MATSNKEVSSAYNFVAVTPSNTVDLPSPCRALYVGVGGDVAVVPLDGSAAVVFKNASNGQFLPIQARRVNSTDTDATNIVALY